MPRWKNRVFSREFKLSAVQRMLGGESVAALSRELTVLPKDLYRWRKQFRLGGEAGLFPRVGRPPKGMVAAAGTKRPAADAPARIAELERKIGQQQADIDFFRAALRQVEGTRRANVERGVTASTKSSKR